MLSLRATYDGRQVHFVDYETLPEIKRSKPVIITFLEEVKDNACREELHLVAQHGGGFDFLASEEEDIYSDADLKRRY